VEVSSSLEVLFRRKAVSILLTLCEKPMSFRELAKTVGGSTTTVKQRLRELEELGLVEEKAMQSFPFKKELKLTEKGRRVAEALKKAEQILWFESISRRICC